LRERLDEVDPVHLRKAFSQLFAQLQRGKGLEGFDYLGGHYRHLYTRAFNNLKEVQQSLIHWFEWYNRERFHQGLDNLTPDEVYYQHQTILQVA